MRIFLRKLHRWLGLLMAVQIIAWMASGLYFSIFPIEEIRGVHLTRVPEPLKAEGLSQLGSPAAVNRELDRRTTRWRVFDFFWMLHVLDFESRDDFNHPLLQVAALLGLLIALSGVIFWAMTTPLFRKKPFARST